MCICALHQKVPAAELCRGAECTAACAECRQLQGGQGESQLAMGVDLEGGHAVLVAQDGEQVVAEGVSHVLAPVGVGALASHIALHGEALQHTTPHDLAQWQHCHWLCGSDPHVLQLL